MGNTCLNNYRINLSAVSFLWSISPWENGKLLSEVSLYSKSYRFSFSNCIIAKSFFFSFWELIFIVTFLKPETGEAFVVFDRCLRRKWLWQKFLHRDFGAALTDACALAWNTNRSGCSDSWEFRAREDTEKRQLFQSRQIHDAELRCCWKANRR